MQNYKPLYKANQLVYGAGSKVIVTGWLPKDKIIKILDPSEYAAIGNLYSAARGINFLVHNLLANPQVTELLTISVTREDRNAGSIDCLYDFFQYGFTAGKSKSGKDCWVIKSNIDGYIDKHIPRESLELLRDSVSVLKVEDKALLRCIPSLSFMPSKKVRINPEIFAINEALSVTIPGTLYGHRIEGATVAETWVKILHRIRTTGVIRPTGYDGNWQELIDLVAVVTDEPQDFYIPEYLPITKKFVASYLPQILDDAPYQEGVKYTYGQRMRSWFGADQITQVIDKLVSEVDAASAVISLWDVKDHDTGGSPCLNHVWIRVVDGELSMTATFRSNDMFGAWPANAMGLRALQRHILNEITRRSNHDLKMGPLITISQSAHIYDDTWENVDYVLKVEYPRICRQDYDDPVGNFVVNKEDGKVIVDHTSPAGELVCRYTGNTPQQIEASIVNAVPGLSPAHAMYLGRTIFAAFWE